MAMIHQGRTIIDGTPDEIMDSTDPDVHEFVSQASVTNQYDVMA